MRSPRADRERLAAEIDQQHHDLAAIVGVDGAGAVEHGDAMLEREARARAHLRLVAGGSSSAKPVGTSARAPGAQLDRRSLGHAGDQIEPGGCVGW